MTKSSIKNRILAPLCLLVAMGCSLSDGVSPETYNIYFPVGLATSLTSDHLIVVNSDFDLQFSQGTVQSFDLEKVRKVLATPCSSDAECQSSELCDNVPSEANSELPSFFCVERDNPVPCGELGQKTADVLAVAPGRCAPIDLAQAGGELITDTAEIDAFATQGILVRRPCVGADGLRRCTPVDGPGDRVQAAVGASYPERLFMPVRGDNAIHFIDVLEDGSFECARPGDAEPGGEAEYPLRCGIRYRVDLGTTYGQSESGGLVLADGPPPDPGERDKKEEKEEEDDPLNEYRISPEPIDLTATSDGRVVVVSHQQNGRASTLVNSWKFRPALVNILEDLPSNPIGVAALPSVYGSDSDRPNFLISSRSNPQINLLEFDDDGLMEAMTAASEIEIDAPVSLYRPALEDLGSSTIATNNTGVVSRGMAIDDTARVEAVAACGADEACLQIARETPLDVFITNRSPNSLLLGRTGGSDLLAKSSNLPRIYDTVPLTAGPARAVMGYVMGETGKKELRVFVICFNDALIYVYDPKTRRVETEIGTGRGPYSLAFDPVLPVAYVGHFTDSYVGAVSLDQRLPMTFGATLATIGVPVSPRAAK